jgi:hypothetical protein
LLVPATRVSDPQLFNADPDPDPVFFLIADPDPDPGLFCEFNSNLFRELLSNFFSYPYSCSLEDLLSQLTVFFHEKKCTKGHLY